MLHHNDHTALTHSPEAMLVLSPTQDRIVFANPRACQLLRLGEPPQNPSQLFAASLAQLVAFTQAVMDQGEGLCDELLVSFNDEEELRLEVTASLLPEQEPPLINLCLRDKVRFDAWRIKRNATKQHSFGLLQWHRIHEVFQQIEKENQLILSAAGEGIYGVDAEGRTTFVNPAAERILGWRADAIIGKNMHAVIHHSHTDGSDYCVQDCPIYAAFRDGAIRKVDNEVFWSKSGKPIAVEYTSTPIMDNGHLVGAVVVFRDVSDRKEAEVKLRNALREVEQLKRRLELENAYLQEEISAGYNSYQIVGRSPAIENIIQQIQLVAPTDATVLICGESGTGKELIARAIHMASDRSERTLVRVNCAAIPAELFESEFFGHVRGAFSGALQDRTGRFQLADGGTLFLDEVGEIPLELQSKLLRVLQDHEFERVGESSTQKVDVRLIAATNRDLETLVDEGKFRKDLFFRLNVFPICSVPLRDRRDDIPLLAAHFLSQACQRFNKPELRMSLETIRKLQNYSWPGNIRELENLIERQVILSRGDKLILDHLPLEPAPQTTSSDVVVRESSLPLTETDYRQLQYTAIVRALQESRGKLYGDNGAANKLGIKPTTLASRMKKLGIDKREFSAG